MRTLELKRVEHNRKKGDRCEYIEPNVFDDCILVEDGEVIGMYIKDVSRYDPALSSLLSVANAEFRSKRVPKQFLDRAESVVQSEKTGIPLSKLRATAGVSQFSTILGSVPKNQRMRRGYHNHSTVHAVDTAKNFVKAMIGSATKGMTLIKAVAPSIHKKQTEIIQDIPDEWRFAQHFTSSISNFNIAAPFHMDTRNLDYSSNLIFTKRANSQGGCLHVPDYNATFEQPDNSLLVYPAWRNLHGVTPIQEHAKGGYRNSLIFYTLRAFIDGVHI